MEIPSMADQPAYQQHFQGASGQELIELFKLRDKSAKEKADAERKEAAELKTIQHYENVIGDAKARRLRP
jgi:hypothetical protein